MATDLGALLVDLRDERAALRALVAGADLNLPTPAEGWDIRDAVSHLAGSDREAWKAAEHPEVFLAELAVVAGDIPGFLAGQLAQGRALSREDLLAWWDEGFGALVTALDAVPDGVKLPWYGPPMSAASMVTARLMEYWAHGQDVADALGVHREPTARLRHICHLGVRTRTFAYANRRLPVPEGDVGVLLEGPDGARWTWAEECPDRVEGTAEDFCLLVTQRRHRDDTGLRATGPLADSWLSVAQCFAGPPGPGRGRRQ